MPKVNGPLINDESLAQELHRLGGLARLSILGIHPSLPSTNDHAWQLFRQGSLSGVVLACQQSQGRGRLGRTWVMQEGDIAMSILLQGDDIPKKPGILAIISAVIIVKALAQLGVEAFIKWPNDILIRVEGENPNQYCGEYLKVGGILVENSWAEKELTASVIGIGLNVVRSKKLQELVPHAGALQQLDAQLNSSALIALILKKFDEALNEASWLQFNHDILEFYRQKCVSLGRVLTINLDDKNESVMGVNITDDGNLLVKIGKNTKTIMAGEVNFCV